MNDLDVIVSGEPAFFEVPSEKSPFRNILSEFIYVRTYSRWIDELGRRESWEETVDRYVSFLVEERPNVPSWVYDQIRSAILSMDVLPSMRALWAAGDAARRDHTTLYNCSFCPLDSIPSFSEALHILMCFHPDTLVQTSHGDKRIADITVDDEVMSVDINTGDRQFVHPERVWQNPTMQTPKLQIMFDDGSEVLCTEDHLFWTKNRGWVAAKDLTEQDDV